MKHKLKQSKDTICLQQFFQSFKFLSYCLKHCFTYLLHDSYLLYTIVYLVYSSICNIVSVIIGTSVKKSNLDNYCVFLFQGIEMLIPITRMRKSTFNKHVHRHEITPT